MPFYLVWLEGEDGRRHLFDTEPIEAESQEDALKIVMGGSQASVPLGRRGLFVARLSLGL